MWFRWKSMSRNLLKSKFQLAWTCMCKMAQDIFFQISLVDFEVSLYSQFFYKRIFSDVKSLLIQNCVDYSAFNEFWKSFKQFLSLIYFNKISIFYDSTLENYRAPCQEHKKNRTLNFSLNCPIYRSHNEYSLWWKFQNVWLIGN
jgi:hypothetical protein